MTVIHDFRQQLEWSEAAGYEPFWGAVYKKAFPNLVNHMMCSGDTASQRMGVDRLLYLANGKIIAIDEKKRKEQYPDILLEYISVNTTGAPGWMNKDLAIDYLAYAFIPTKRCYLFPWPFLRRAWLHYRDQWIEEGEKKSNGFRIVEAKNVKYKTLSVAVPIKAVQDAVQLAAIIDVSTELGNWQPPSLQRNQ